MPYIPPEVLQEIKKVDLKTYLKEYEPRELVHFSGDVYTTRTHDSIKISNGKWTWWGTGIGGRTALDYLIKVRGLNFMEAAELMLDQMRIKPLSHVPMPEQEELKEKKLLLPEPYRYQEYVTSYLRRRGIDEEIIEFCLKTGRIYESAYHHNAVFVGIDRDRVPRYAALRGIGIDFIGEASGSDKNYSFSVTAREESKEVHLFESAIDLLSYGTLRKQHNLEWRADYLLSLAGVYQPAKEIEQSKVPATLARFLKEHPEVDTIVFHLDNDRAGRMATRAITTVLPQGYRIRDEPPKLGKDYNDYLCIHLEIPITKRESKSKGIAR